MNNNSDESSEEELAAPLPDRFVWTDGDIKIIEPLSVHLEIIE